MTISRARRRYRFRAALALALGSALVCAAPAYAQQIAASDPEQANDDVVVTGSRIDVAGGDRPTPTTVVGDLELRQGARSGIAQVLNDLPQFRATNTPQTQVANMNSGITTADLRGLGVARTLPLLNGRRSLIGADLGAVPLPLVRRVEVVTGGAAAAYGSGAVAGVVNILLDDRLGGLSLTAQSGIHDRGDGARYGVDGGFGTSFADGRGHIMIGGGWLRDRGVLDRASRPNVGSTAVYANPTYTATNGQNAFFLARDVNYADASYGGLIVSGALAGQTFNPDGTLRPFVFSSPRTSALMIGGEGTTINDEYPASAPYERFNSFARASFDIGGATLWAEGGYFNISARYPFYSENNRGNITVSRDNPFVPQAVRDRLVAAGEASFRVGRLFRDYGLRTFSYERQTIEGSIGVDGSFSGDRWRYAAWYTHSEFRDDQAYDNLRVTANFNQAIDVVRDPVSGNPICRVALTNPATACRPLNILGEGRATPEAAAFAFGPRATGGTLQKLDSGGATLRGEPFALWAGPVGVAIGVEARREAISPRTIDPISLARGFSFNFTALSGSFSVREGFAEVQLPLLDRSGAKVAANGAARYSDYSTSGGIWSWKLGGTARLFDDLLLRVSRSRDIRSPSISELFNSPTVGTGIVADPVTGQTFTVPRTTGGNANLQPEIGSTFTAGASYAPGWLPGLSLSADWYDISIDGLITNPSAQDTVTRCFQGQLALCPQITRDPVTRAITALSGRFVNFSNLTTSGVDFEASYRVPVASLFGSGDGQVRFRVLGNYTDTRATDDGVVRIETAGTVGDSYTGVPHWRGVGSIAYEGRATTVDARVRVAGGGFYNETIDISNNRIGARTYLDLSAEQQVGPFSLRASIVNVFDRDPPLTTYGQVFYDQLGRFINISAAVRF